MTAWKIAYENRFPRNAVSGDTVLFSFRAAEGRQDVTSGPVFTAFTGFGGFGIGSGRNLFYRPASFLPGVIGLDVTLHFGVIALFGFGVATLFTAGAGGLRARLEATGAPTTGGLLRCRLTITAGGQSAIVDELVFRESRNPAGLETRRLRVRWESKGQLQVWLDDDLVAFDNSVGVGAGATLDRVIVGDADNPSTGFLHATVSYMRVVELREEAATGELGTMIDPAVVPEIDERCRKSSDTLLERILRDTRALMAAFNASQTQPWRSGMPGSPFSDKALQAHKEATAAARAFSVYIRSGAEADRQTLVNHLKAMLGILAADQPDAFKALAQTAKESREGLNEHCKYAAQAVRDQNPALFARLDPVSDELEQVIADLGGTI